jgi:hypothetical protein
MIEKWTAALKAVSPLSYSETFDDQVHGWMTSRYENFVTPRYVATGLTSERADFNDVHKFKEYLRGYRIVRTFLAQYL